MEDVVDRYISPFLLSLLVSTGIGLIIGLEREFRKGGEKDHLAGLRTFPLVAILGCIITYVSSSLTSWLVVVALFAFMLFVGASYYRRYSPEHPGITTEVSLIITFILGAMTSLQLIREALAAAVITTTLLSLKGKFDQFVSTITEEELFAFIKFIILCMLLLPFLPDTQLGPGGILNPQEVGFVVVIVTSISLAAYLLIKFTGAYKGILLTALFGGLFSSTAVTWTLSTRSSIPGQSGSAPYAQGIILACSLMFIRVALVALIFNRTLFLPLLLPCSTMFLTGLGFVFYHREKEKDVPAVKMDLGNPTNIINALTFGLMYIVIALLVYYGNEYFGSQGLLLTGLISGFVDVDAITINISKLTTATTSINLSVSVILTAMASNTIVKIGITIAKAPRHVKMKVATALGTAIVAGIVTILVKSLITTGWR
jgi:uncharacterized membrane protein (DUF4010 family)